MSEVNYSNAETIIVGGEKYGIYLSEEKIQAKVKELGGLISAEYAGKTPVFIGVLNGSFIFMSDLIKNVSIDCEIDFFKLSSYGDSKISSGTVKKLKDLNCDINGRDVIIVEDIVDTGLSIKYIEELLDQYKPSSVKLASLLVKPNSLKYKVKIDYIGFEIPSDYVVGYGLDYAQKYRNLRSIYILQH
jgi:hypoxanthine phosphoribosyltransferase